MILLENSEAQRRHYEHKCEDMAQRLRETERLLQAAQKEINNYQVSYCLMVMGLCGCHDGSKSTSIKALDVV